MPACMRACIHAQAHTHTSMHTLPCSWQPVACVQARSPHTAEATTKHCCACSLLTVAVAARAWLDAEAPPSCLRTTKLALMLAGPGAAALKLTAAIVTCMRNCLCGGLTQQAAPGWRAAAGPQAEAEGMKLVRRQGKQRNVEQDIMSQAGQPV